MVEEPEHRSIISNFEGFSGNLSWLPQTSNRKRFLDSILHLESQETSLILILSIGTSVARKFSGLIINLQHIQNHHQITIHLLGRNVKNNAKALDLMLIPLQVDRPAIPKATIWKITPPIHLASIVSEAPLSRVVRLSESSKNKWLMARAAHFLATCNVIFLLLWDIFPTSKVISVALGIQPENEETIRSSTQVHQNGINVPKSSKNDVTRNRNYKNGLLQQEKRNSNDKTMNMLRWKPIFGSRMLFVLVRSIAS